MSALQVIQSNLIQSAGSPVGNNTGGTSPGNPAAGTIDANPVAQLAAITTADRAGAGVVTTIIIILTLGVVWYVQRCCA